MTMGAGIGNAGNNLSQSTPLSVAAPASMMGLNPVKLEQRFFALYSMYTNHIGEGKEATQVATKYMISDLGKV